MLGTPQLITGSRVPACTSTSCSQQSVSGLPNTLHMHSDFHWPLAFVVQLTSARRSQGKCKLLPAPSDAADTVVPSLRPIFRVPAPQLPTAAPGVFLRSLEHNGTHRPLCSACSYQVCYHRPVFSWPSSHHRLSCHRWSWRSTIIAITAIL